MKRRRFLRSTGASAAALLGAAASRRAGAQAEPHEKDEVPELPFSIVDTHVHFWDTGHLRYPWLEGSGLLNRPYLPRDYEEAIGPVAVERVVFVEAACAGGQEMAEVDWVSALAKQEGRIQGIVANAPVEKGDGVLPALEALAANPLVKGIRRFLPSRDGGAQAISPGFAQGVEHLEQVGFSFDLGVGRGQIPAAAKLVRQCPKVKFMLNHIGVPDIKNQILDPWRQEIRDLAQLPNVFCKMSGAATSADLANWTPADLEPVLDHVIDCFGFERTAFGSDWPVMLSATPYPRWVGAAAWAVRGCSQAELRQLFRGTAMAFYKLTGNRAETE